VVRVGTAVYWFIGVAGAARRSTAGVGCWHFGMAGNWNLLVD